MDSSAVPSKTGTSEESAEPVNQTTPVQTFEYSVMEGTDYLGVLESERELRRGQCIFDSGRVLFIEHVDEIGRGDFELQVRLHNDGVYEKAEWTIRFKKPGH